MPVKVPLNIHTSNNPPKWINYNLLFSIVQISFLWYVDTQLSMQSSSHAKFRGRMSPWMLKLQQRGCSRFAKTPLWVTIHKQQFLASHMIQSYLEIQHTQTQGCKKNRYLELEQEPPATCHAIPSELSWYPCLWLEFRHDMPNAESGNPQEQFVASRSWQLDQSNVFARPRC